MTLYLSHSLTHSLTRYYFNSFQSLFLSPTLYLQVFASTYQFARIIVALINCSITLLLLVSSMEQDDSGHSIYTFLVSTAIVWRDFILFFIVILYFVVLSPSLFLPFCISVQIIFCPLHSCIWVFVFAFLSKTIKQGAWCHAFNMLNWIFAPLFCVFVVF